MQWIKLILNLNLKNSRVMVVFLISLGVVTGVGFYMHWLWFILLSGSCLLGLGFYSIVMGFWGDFRIFKSFRLYIDIKNFIKFIKERDGSMVDGKSVFYFAKSNKSHELLSYQHYVNLESQIKILKTLRFFYVQKWYHKDAFLTSTEWHWKRVFIHAYWRQIDGVHWLGSYNSISFVLRGMTDFILTIRSYLNLFRFIKKKKNGWIKKMLFIW